MLGPANETAWETQKHMQGLETGGDNIRGQVFDRCAKSSRIMTGPLSPAEFSD